MKERLARVREVIKRELGTVLEKEITFPGGLVTVSHVDVTPDLRQCHVYVSVLGTEAEKLGALETLEKNRVLLQTHIARRVILKYTPKLFFKPDDSIARGSRVIEIMDQIGLTGDAPGAQEEEP